MWNIGGLLYYLYSSNRGQKKNVLSYPTKSYPIKSHRFHIQSYPHEIFGFIPSPRSYCLPLWINKNNSPTRSTRSSFFNSHLTYPISKQVDVGCPMNLPIKIQFISHTTTFGIHLVTLAMKHGPFIDDWPINPGHIFYSKLEEISKGHGLPSQNNGKSTMWWIFIAIYVSLQ